jgi:hypothetical protein
LGFPGWREIDLRLSSVTIFRIHRGASGREFRGKNR